MVLRPASRRAFLKSAGCLLALPALESLGSVAAPDAAAPPRRMVCIGNEFGMYGGAFWPKASGSDYEMTPLLAPLARHRQRFTLFSHLDHDVRGGHFAIHSYLTGVKLSKAKAMPDGGISLDQRAAEFVGSATRFPSLALGSADGLHGGCQMSWTRTGTRVPPIAGPRELFNALFVQESAESRHRAKDRIALQGSILDAVRDDAHALNRQLSKRDQEKLDEYFSALRAVERKLKMDRQWQDVPKPHVAMETPENQGLTRDLPALFDLLALALESDSTRIATLEIGKGFAASDLGIKSGYHSVSHHGHDPQKVETLVKIERYQMEQYARFLGKLHSIREVDSDETLLDRTMVMFGSGMGNGNAHTNHDLPIILAGGGFKHGEHKAYPVESKKRIPLANLYASMLQRFGLETERFAAGTGTLTGLEWT